MSVPPVLHYKEYSTIGDMSP